MVAAVLLTGCSATAHADCETLAESRQVVDEAIAENGWKVLRLDNEPARRFLASLPVPMADHLDLIFPPAFNGKVAVMVADGRCGGFFHHIIMSAEVARNLYGDALR